MSVTTAPTVRIRPAPRSEPLADDERGTGRMLPPDLATGVRVRRGVRQPPAVLQAVVTAPLHTPPADEPQPHLSAEIVTVVAPGLAAALPDEVEPAPPPGSHEVRLAARRLLGTCVEVIGGFRPINQLRPYCAPERFDAIVNRLTQPIGTGRGHGATRSSLIARTFTPPKPGRPPRTPPQDRVTVRRVQICDVMEGVAELAVVMARRGKIWAMAMRLERSRGRWQCMHMEVL